MKFDSERRWELIDRIAEETIRYGTVKTTIKDTLDKLTVKPLTGIPFAMAVLYGFWAFFGAFEERSGYHKLEVLIQDTNKLKTFTLSDEEVTKIETIDQSERMIEDSEDFVRREFEEEKS